MDVRKRGLGRGLGALIPAGPAPTTSTDGAGQASLPLDQISKNPFQPRNRFDEPAIDELAASIRAKGILQPIIVRRTGDGQYELIAGERRLRAAQRAGLPSVPVIVREADDREALELALIENLQRENLNPLEEARALHRLHHEFQLGHEAIALQLGKSRSAVTNSLRLLQLPADVQSKIESGSLSAGHARALLGVDSAATRSTLAGEVADRRLSVRATEKLARQRSPAPRDVEHQAVEADLARSLGTRVRLRHRADGTGRIVIEYYSLDELNGLLDRLGGSHTRSNAF